jgi:hypothetical protein
MELSCFKFTKCMENDTKLKKKMLIENYQLKLEIETDKKFFFFWVFHSIRVQMAINFIITFML